MLRWHRDRRPPKPRALRTWLFAAPGPADGRGRPSRPLRRRAARREAPPVVEGDVPDRRRLLLDPRLPARHRGARGRSPGPDRHRRPRAGDPVRCVAGLPPGGRGEPARPGVDRDARAAAAVLEGQALRAGPARIRGHGLHDHHHPVGGRRVGARRGEPARARAPARPGAGHHARAGRAARRGVPAGLHRGDRHSRGAGRDLPGPQPRGHRRLALARRREPGRHQPLDRRR